MLRRWAGGDARGGSRGARAERDDRTQAAGDRPTADRDDAGPPTDEAPFTFLQRGTVVRGALEAVGRVRLHGRVEGDVRVRGLLEVAEDGEVIGSRIDVDELKVLGRVHGHVHARLRVELWKGCTLEGDVTTPSLDVEEGATFVGRSAMPRGDDAAPALAAPAAEGAEVAGAAGAAGAPGEAPDAAPLRQGVPEPSGA